MSAYLSLQVTNLMLSLKSLAFVTLKPVCCLAAFQFSFNLLMKIEQ